jgi:hypothetical protein
VSDRQLTLNLTIDPADPKNHGKRLWVLYGHECMPSIMCCMLRAYTEDHTPVPVGKNGHHVVIWGYSVYREKPGFRTLGQNLTEWSERSSYGPLFFETQKPALDELGRITTPSPDAL